MCLSVELRCSSSHFTKTILILHSLALEAHHEVTMPNGGQSVGDADRGNSAFQFFQSLGDRLFFLSIEDVGGISQN